MKAKTYRSSNNWSAPQSLSSFGIPIGQKRNIKFLGLEEFNFSNKLSEIKFENKSLAYIPCFSQTNRPYLNHLDLFYSAGNNVTYHYATLYGVQQIDKDIIGEIRKRLNQENFLEWVENNQEFINNYGDIFRSAFQVYIQNFHVGNVIAQGHNTRFVFNVLYDKVIFHNPEIQVPWANLTRAKHLYV